MSRDGNKIESIAVNAVSQQINGYDLLQPCLATNDKTPFFDGYILVYKEPKQTNANYESRIAVQIKGREVSRFSKENKCSFSVRKSELNAFWQEGGVLFFVVEIHKYQKNAHKIYVHELLPFNINAYNNGIAKNKQQSISIQLRQLKEGQLQLVCQNFLVDKEKQAHKNFLPVTKIKGFESLNLSILTGCQNTAGWNKHMLDGNPLYLYAEDQNGFEIPIGNIQQGILQMISHDEVFVGEKSFGKLYAKDVLDKNGHYLQFGESCKFLPNGEMKFSESGSLDNRIKDIDFILRICNGETISLGNNQLSDWSLNSSEHELKIHELKQTYEYLKTIKQGLDFLGMKGPVDITTCTDDDLYKMFLYGKSISDGSRCSVKFKNEGINILRFGDYYFAVFYHQAKIINFFSREFYKKTQTIIKLNENKIIPISIYWMINTEYITKAANFDGEVVMESIRDIPFSLFIGCHYTQLLLESIKAIDVSPRNKSILDFANNLADYLIENEDSIIHRLNKLQIKKRVGSLDAADTDWLLTESKLPHEARILCGIAILLDNSKLFEEQFANLSETKQEEFMGYPIMKLYTQPVQ
ncbi:MAG: hypothetical protein ACRC2T_20300 [Thermoguttaceae bacterium]